MRTALAVAQQASVSGDVPVGAVIVNSSGEIVAIGHNERELNNDPTAHAEMVAIRKAAQTLGQWRPNFPITGAMIPAGSTISAQPSSTRPPIS